MDALLARATLVVCRSGAGTIAELTVAGVPSVLVPLPGSPSDHQVRNAQHARAGRRGRRRARRRVRRGAPRRGRVSSCSAIPMRLERMGRAADELGRPDAAARVADLVEEVRACRLSRPPVPPSARSRYRRSISLAPRTLHIVGVGGVGMSAIALLLVRMGHHVSGSDIKESVGPRPPRSGGRARARGQPRRERPRRCRRRHLLDGDTGAERRAGRRARARRHRAAPVGRARGARRDAPHDRGGRLARQDHHVVDARAHPARRRLATELRHRRRGQRGRRQRGLRRGRVARGRGRRERRHVPAARARGRDRDERRARPPRLLRGVRAARRRVRAVRRRRARRDRVLRRRPGCGAHRAGAPARSYLRFAVEHAHYRMVDVSHPRRHRTVHAGVAEGRVLGELVVPLAVHAANECRRRERARAGARRAVRRRSPRRCGASAAWPAASSGGASSTASRSSTTTPTSPARSRPRSRRPGAAAGAG